MNEQTLLAYGLRELAAFRIDKRDMLEFIDKDLGESHTARRRAVCAAISDVIRAQDERRNAAGMTRSQAERACMLAATVEKVTP